MTPPRFIRSVGSTVVYFSYGMHSWRLVAGLLSPLPTPPHSPVGGQLMSECVGRSVQSTCRARYVFWHTHTHSTGRWDFWANTKTFRHAPGFSFNHARFNVACPLCWLWGPGRGMNSPTLCCWPDIVAGGHSNAFPAWRVLIVLNAVLGLAPPDIWYIVRPSRFVYVCACLFVCVSRITEKVWERSIFTLLIALWQHNCVF